MFRIHRWRWLTCALAATLLFAEGAAAAGYCRAASDSPLMAYVEMDCADMPSQNVCLRQYLSGDEVSSTAQVPVAPLPQIPVLVVALPEVALPPGLKHHTDGPQPGCDPPTPIGFGNFRS